jgi:copper chaperone CopZ
MMTGGHCKGAIEKEVGKLEGVTSVLADPASKDVMVLAYYVRVPSANKRRNVCQITTIIKNGVCVLGSKHALMQYSTQS